MPGTSLTEIKCDKCEKVFETEVVDHVDLAEDGALAPQLKSGKLNRVVCPQCKKLTYLERGLVVNFEPESLIVVFDSSAKTPEAKVALRKEYDALIHYNQIFEEVGKETEFRVISELDELKKLVDNYVRDHWLSESEPLFPK
jgi:phage FluMu protein Com